MKRIIYIAALALLLISCSSSNNDDSDSGSNTTTGGTTAGGTNTGDTIAPIELEVVGQSLLVALAGFQADKLSLAVRELAVEIAAAAESTPMQASTFEILDGFGPEDITAPTQVTAYTCNAGGMMTHETGSLRSGVGTERSLSGDYDAYTFDGCRHSETGGIFSAGDYQLNGSLVMNATDYNAARGNRSTHSNTWGEFSMSAPADQTYALSGSVGSIISDDFDERTVTLPSYVKSTSGVAVESLSDVRLTLIRNIPNGSTTSGYELEVSGTLANAATGNTDVVVSTDPLLTGLNNFAEGAIEPFSGQIRMVAADTGELTISANAASQISIEPGALLVDLVAMRPNGDTFTTEAVPLIDILADRLDCFLNDATDDGCLTAELP